MRPHDSLVLHLDSRVSFGRHGFAHSWVIVGGWKKRVILSQQRIWTIVRQVRHSCSFTRTDRRRRLSAYPIEWSVLSIIVAGEFRYEATGAGCDAHSRYIRGPAGLVGIGGRLSGAVSMPCGRGGVAYLNSVARIVAARQHLWQEWTNMNFPVGLMTSRWGRRGLWRMSRKPAPTPEGSDCRLCVLAQSAYLAKPANEGRFAGKTGRAPTMERGLAVALRLWAYCVLGLCEAYFANMFLRLNSACTVRSMRSVSSRPR